MNDIIIIGGGISGLYTYYQLLQKNPKLKIKLFEKNNYFGGRILTLTKKLNHQIYQFEAGAGRFNSKHTYFLRLIKKLKLEKEIIQISGKSDFIPTSSFSLKSNKEFKNKNAYFFIHKVVKAGLKEKQEILIKYTFKEYAKKILTSKQIEFMLSSSGYYGELVYENAYDAIKIFNEGIRDDIHYYVMKNGFSSIIQKLVQTLVKKKAKLYLKSELTTIQKIKEGFLLNINNIEFKTKKIILALPKPALLELQYLKPYTQLLNSIDCKDLCRIYSIFKDIWFKNIHKTTTNNKLRFIIPINKESGLIMSSYTDSIYAKMWKKYIDKPNELKKELVKELQEVFQVPIQKPIYNTICYWNCGVGYWKKNKNSQVLSKKILQLNPEEQLYIVGENYSTNQGWNEGGLETVHELLQLLRI